jgi:hypothetical protein
VIGAIEEGGADREDDLDAADGAGVREASGQLYRSRCLFSPFWFNTTTPHGHTTRVVSVISLDRNLIPR